MGVSWDKEQLGGGLKELKDHFTLHGQDLETHLSGMLHTNFLSYWDYIRLDTLTSLQVPKTDYPDELIFIGYHQISEIYFKLILSELQQIIESEHLVAPFVTEKLGRCVRYMENLIQSFDIMVHGLDREQFAAFRLALFPASGFQSAQYRRIEILCTDFANLLSDGHRNQLINDFEAGFDELYWVKASTKPDGEKYLAQQQFEARYRKEMVQEAASVSGKTVYRAILSLSKREEGYTEMINMARMFDYVKNQKWPNGHMKAARHHLSKPGEDAEATGGTGWQKYLPPKYQRIIFFPLFWSEDELKNWGNPEFELKGS